MKTWGRFGRGLVLGATAWLVLGGCRKAGDGEKGGKPPKVIKAAGWVVAPAVFPEARTLLAEVQADREVDLRVEVAGRLEALPLRDGQAVKAGQILARIDEASARADRARAEAKVRLAASRAARVGEQVRVEAASRADLEAAEADLAVARADLAASEAELARHVVAAPFSGRVGLVGVVRGQWLTAGQTVARLVGDGPLRLEAALPEAGASWLRTGDRLAWRAAGGADSGTAVVEALEPALDEGRTRPVRARVTGPASGLLPGGTVELSLRGDDRPVLSVPPRALSGDARGPLVWVARGGKAVSVPVVPGRRGAEALEIERGLAPGDTVLLPGGSTPKAGAAVEIVRILSGSRP